jgi:hypothetical protein
LQVGDAPNDEIAAAFVGQAAVLASNGPRSLAPEAHVAVKLPFREQARIQSIIEVVAVVSDFIRQVGRLGFERRGLGIEARPFAGVIVGGGVLEQPLAHLPRQVQAGEAWIPLFEFLDDAQALAIVLEPAEILHQPVEHRLALVAERGVAEIVRQRNGFGEVLIQPQRTGDIARNPGNFHGVRQPRAEVVAGAVEKDLGLIFEAAEGARVNHPVTVPLVMRAPFGRCFMVLAPARVGAELGIRGQALAFECLQFLSRAGHGWVSRKAKQSPSALRREQLLDGDAP